MTLKSRKGDCRELKSRAFHGDASPDSSGDAWRVRGPRTLQETCAYGARLGNRLVFILDPRLSPPPLLPDHKLTFSRTFHLCVISIIWEPGTSSFRCEMSNHSKPFKWFFAYSNPQSIAVIRLIHPEQSSRFCSLRETSFPVFLKCCPSSDPVTLNAQDLPNSPGKYNRT